jgi:hypothetical protein
VIAHDENTPIDRPLTRGDLNEIRDIVHSISERQLAFVRAQEAVEKRVTRLEKQAWLPSLVAVVAAALAVLARVAP